MVKETVRDIFRDGSVGMAANMVGVRKGIII